MTRTDKTIVIKLGGSVMEDARALAKVAHDIVDLRDSGTRVVVVHGGGLQVTRFLERLGVKSEFRGGHRVTTPEVRDVARMVLTGQVQREIVNEINKIRAVAVGLSGEDAHLFVVSRRTRQSNSSEEDLGLVGQVQHVNVELIKLLLDSGLVPVISSIGPAPDNESYNVNADSAAGAVAGALHADRFIVLTDVAGLYANWPSTERVIGRLSVDEVLDIYASLSEGMLPKMEACVMALKGGARQAHVVDGRVPRVLHEVSNGKSIGTEVTLN